MGDYEERDPWTGRMEGRNMTPNELGREAARRDIATMREHLEGAPRFADCPTAGTGPLGMAQAGWKRCRLPGVFDSPLRSGFQL